MSLPEKSISAEAELEGEGGIDTHLIHDFLECIVVCNFREVKFAIIGIQTRLAVDLQTQIDSEIYAAARHGLTPADTYIRTEAVHIGIPPETSPLVFAGIT